MQVELWMWVGFLLASLSVVWNDSIQTLGTYMNSNKDVKWYHLWLGASTVLVLAILYGWYVNNGDIAYGRLSEIPYVQVEWYHALAPLVLLGLTVVGIPVSTSFLVLSVFSSTIVLEKMLGKSLNGLVVGALVSMVLWFMLAHAVKRFPVDLNNLGPNWDKWARRAQAGSTALLWMMWVTHDISNVAVFLPRQVPWEMLPVILFVFVAGLGLVFRYNGGRIQKIVKSKTNTQFVISATIIDLAYAGVLYYFKTLDPTPMSTTWVFVGILLGREFIIRRILVTKKSRKMLPMIVSDLSKLIFGALVSVGLALFVQGHLGKLQDAIMEMNWLFVTSIAIVAIIVVVGVIRALRMHGEEEQNGDPQTTTTLP